MDKNNDFTRIIKKEHEKNWVALNKDRTKVIAYDKSLSALQDKLGKKKDSAIYTKILPSDTIFAF